MQKVRIATLDLGTSNVAIQYLRLCLGVAVLRSDLDYVRREMDGIVAARGIRASEDLKSMSSMTSTIITGSGTPA